MGELRHAGEGIPLPMACGAVLPQGASMGILVASDAFTPQPQEACLPLGQGVSVSFHVTCRALEFEVPTPEGEAQSFVPESLGSGQSRQAKGTASTELEFIPVVLGMASAAVRRSARGKRPVQAEPPGELLLDLPVAVSAGIGQASLAGGMTDFTTLPPREGIH